MVIHLALTYAQVYQRLEQPGCFPCGKLTSRLPQGKQPRAQGLTLLAAQILRAAKNDHPRGVRHERVLLDTCSVLPQSARSSPEPISNPGDDLERAAHASERATTYAPHWSGPWYNLGLMRKYHGRAVFGITVFVPGAPQLS